MKVEFITGLLKHDQIDNDNWRIREPFVGRVICDEWPEPFLIVVPGGYVTDFESVPKVLILAYALIKGKARKSATLHDYVLDFRHKVLLESLTTNLIPFVPSREWCDRLFYAAMKEEGTGALAREVAYAGVSAYTAISGGK